MLLMVTICVYIYALQVYEIIQSSERKVESSLLGACVCVCPQTKPYLPMQIQSWCLHVCRLRVAQIQRQQNSTHSANAGSPENSRGHCGRIRCSSYADALRHKGSDAAGKRRGSEREGDGDGDGDGDRDRGEDGDGDGDVRGRKYGDGVKCKDCETYMFIRGLGQHDDGAMIYTHGSKTPNCQKRNEQENEELWRALKNLQKHHHHHHYHGSLS